MDELTAAAHDPVTCAKRTAFFANSSVIDGHGSLMTSARPLAPKPEGLGERCWCRLHNRDAGTCWRKLRSDDLRVERKQLVPANVKHDLPMTMEA